MELPGLMVVLALAALFIAVAVAVAAWSGRGARRARGSARAAQRELGGRARHILLEADDALRNAERELTYARATFGADEVAGLAGALEESRRLVDGAFALGRQIDDEVEESTEVRRDLLDRIVADCTRARSDVDAQVARITELRAIASDPAVAIREAAAEITSQAAAIDASAAAIEAQRDRYAGSSLRGVVAMPAEARASLAIAQVDLERARDATSPQDAAVAVRSANVAIARSRELTTAVERQLALLLVSADRLTRLRSDAVAAIDTAQDRLDSLARTTPATDPATHELRLAGDRLSGARSALQEADAALSGVPSDVEAATSRLTAAVTLAGGAANALTSVDASRHGAEHAYVSANALAGEAIAQGEAWLTDGRAPTTEERRLRATLASARGMLTQAADLVPQDPVRATAMAWTAHHAAALVAAELDPARVAPEQVGTTVVDVAGPLLLEFAFELAVAAVIGGVDAAVSGGDGGLGGGHTSGSGGLGGGHASGSGSGLGGGHHGSGGF